MLGGQARCASRCAITCRHVAIGLWCVLLLLLLLTDCLSECVVVVGCFFEQRCHEHSYTLSTRTRTLTACVWEKSCLSFHPANHPTITCSIMCLCDAHSLTPEVLLALILPLCSLLTANRHFSTTYFPQMVMNVGIKPRQCARFRQVGLRRSNSSDLC